MNRAFGNKYNLGFCKPGFEAKIHPTSLDIAWAAGIFEGEGHCYWQIVKTSGTQRVRVGQKDSWILYKLKDLFGGSVRTNNNKWGLWYVWDLNGSRARGFLMTIYKFLFPQRKEQVFNTLKEIKMKRRGYNYVAGQSVT